MFRQLDRSEIKAEARDLLRTGSVSPIRMTLVLLALYLIFEVIDTGTGYAFGANLSIDIDSISNPYLLADALSAFGSLAFFISILISLIKTVLSAGYTCYCFGIHRREDMPYESLFDAFSFAGKVILLEVVLWILIFLWSLLLVIPGFIAAYRYSFAMLNLCENPDLSVMEALRLSKQQTMGYKWQFFVLDLSFIGWYLLGSVIVSVSSLLYEPLMPGNLFGGLLSAALYMLSYSIVASYLMPYTELSKCGFYLRATAPLSADDFIPGTDEGGQI